MPWTSAKEMPGQKNKYNSNIFFFVKKGRTLMFFGLPLTLRRVDRVVKNIYSEAKECNFGNAVNSKWS
jgi:hypothetical protein